VTFTAIPQNQGTMPVYQWQVNGTNVGTNSATYTATNLNNNDDVQCILSSSLSCATGNPASSNIIQVTVSANVTASLGVTVTDNQICTGETVTFTATPSNGGSTPAYQWYMNGNPLAGYTSETVTTSSVPNGANIYCEMTSSESCVSGSPALSNTIVMAVADVPVAGFTYVPNQLDISFTNTSTGATSLLWDFGDGQTSTDVNPVHTYAVDGMYIVTLTIYNSCDTVNVMQSVNAYGTGFSNLISGVTVAVYPNPNKGEFYVSVSSGEMVKMQIEVSDLVGRNIFATEATETSGKNLYSIDLGENENGVYLVKVTIGDNTSIYRIMVQ
jgi:PKD repeat protein